MISCRIRSYFKANPTRILHTCCLRPEAPLAVMIHSEYSEHKIFFARTESPISTAKISMWDNYDNFRVASIRLISNLNLKNEIQGGIRLNPPIFFKYSKMVSRDSWMDPGSTKQMSKISSQIFPKTIFHYPPSSPKSRRRLPIFRKCKNMLPTVVHKCTTIRPCVTHIAT